MAENLEIEFKTMLTKSEYTQLLRNYDVPETAFHQQTNVYFDDPTGSLKEKKYGLRIRVLDDHAELTLKTPEKIGLLETTDILSLEQADQAITKGNIPKKTAVSTKLEASGLSVSELKPIGQLTTKRAEFHIDEGLLALDENWSNALHDYELELEVSEATIGKRRFDTLLEKNQLPYRPAKNKIIRMIDSLD